MMIPAKSTSRLARAVSDFVMPLDPSDQQFLIYRFGLTDGRSRTVSDTARRFGLNVEEAQRREAGLLRLFRVRSLARTLAAGVMRGE